MLKGWSFMRIVRFVLAIMIIIQSVMTKDVIPGVLGGILLLGALFNAGCCGRYGCNSGTCNAPSSRNHKDQVID